MTKKIMIPCVVQGKVLPSEFYIGKPADGTDPIHFQTKWFGSAKNGSVPPHVIKAIQDLQKISLETGVSFEELCDLAFNKKDDTTNSGEGNKTNAG